MMLDMATKQSSILVAFRLPKALVDELDAFAEFLGAQMPGMEPRRADALRMAAIRGMTEIRRDFAEGRSGKRKK